MIQVGTKLNIIDNSGAKSAYCIKILKGYKRRYANIGDFIIVVVDSLRQHRKNITKVKRGETYKALILRSKNYEVNSFGDKYSFTENSVVLFTRQNKFLFSKVFGHVSEFLRSGKYLKVVTISYGILR